MTLARLLAVGLCCAPLLAQKGDRPGEAQAPLPADLAVPDAAPKSSADELATLRVRAGFTVQLFASEPFVADPVAAQVDAHGRLWIVEMRSYMNDLEATGESAPTGRIVVLHDDDGDGVAEASKWPLPSPNGDCCAPISSALTPNSRRCGMAATSGQNISASQEGWLTGAKPRWHHT